MDEKILKAIEVLRREVDECLELIENVASLGEASPMEQWVRTSIMGQSVTSGGAEGDSTDPRELLKQLEERVNYCIDLIDRVQKMSRQLRALVAPVRITRPDRIIEELSRYALKMARQEALLRKSTIIARPSTQHEQPRVEVGEIDEKLLQEIDKKFKEGKYYA